MPCRAVDIRDMGYKDHMVVPHGIRCDYTLGHGHVVQAIAMAANVDAAAYQSAQDARKGRRRYASAAKRLSSL
jgi:hypothetical protein